jgi:hypothetical protein
MSILVLHHYNHQLQAIMKLKFTDNKSLFLIERKKTNSCLAYSDQNFRSVYMIIVVLDASF